MDADVFISLTHFKGHEVTGFGGAIKNIGMGCGSPRRQEGAAQQRQAHHRSRSKCRGCRRCQRECANDGLVFDETTRKMHVDHDALRGLRPLPRRLQLRRHRLCQRQCHRGCSTAAWPSTPRRWWTAVPTSTSRWCCDISPNCDCHAENDVPILPDVGMFASFDPLALDQACVDACLKQQPLPGSSADRADGQSRTSATTTTTSRTAPPSPSTRPAWNMRQRSASAPASTTSSP